VLQRAELSGQADSENNLGGSSETMYYIELDVHKRTISYCVKDAAGHVHSESKIGSLHRSLAFAPTAGKVRFAVSCRLGQVAGLNLPKSPAGTTTAS
jgi:hypothetical protein